MLLLFVLCSVVLFTFIAIAIIYFKLIYPQKQLYNKFRAQGISAEPFVPLVGQLPEIRKKRNKDEQMIYQEELVAKHGNVYVFGFGPLTRLVLVEPNLLADLLSRNNATNYEKPSDFVSAFQPIIGSHNLLISGGSEHERARRMLNPAFHHINLKSMISIITDRTSKSIESMLSK
ncbi:unnamed protein product, partial [Rotaria magnacalcarata]